jgi:hypothetical protein
MAMQTPALQDVIRRVMEPVLQDRMLSFPWYQPWVRSAEQAQAAWDRLPLVYSWNEVLNGNRLEFFTVSVNGGRVAELLEQHLPRTHPAFGPTRDLLTTVLAKAQNGFLVELCTELRMTPSQLSASLKH